MAVDLGLRGAAKRLREGAWYETAAQVERAADEIARLTEAHLDVTRAYLAMIDRADVAQAAVYRLTAQRDALLAALTALVQSGAQYDDERISWVEMQIERADLERARAAIAAAEETT